MKSLAKDSIRRKHLASVSTSTLGEIKGVIEGAGLYTPAIRIS